jgi:hypothetical protein
VIALSSDADHLILPPRTPWVQGFPDVSVHTSVALRDAHPGYADAKSGDLAAALTLSQDLLNPATIEVLRASVAIAGAILMPVTALEIIGFNAIPDAMAQLLSEALGWPVSAGDVVQKQGWSHQGSRI